MDTEDNDEYSQQIYRFAKNNDLTSVLKELSNGFDQYTKDWRGWTIWHWFALHNNLDAIKQAIDRYNFNQYTKDDSGWTIWHWFASNHNLDAMKEVLYKYNFNINIKKTILSYCNNKTKIKKFKNKINKRLLIVILSTLNEDLCTYYYKLLKI